MNFILHTGTITCTQRMAVQKVYAKWENSLGGAAYLSTNPNLGMKWMYGSTEPILDPECKTVIATCNTKILSYNVKDTTNFYIVYTWEEFGKPIVSGQINVMVSPDDRLPDVNLMGVENTVIFTGRGSVVVPGHLPVTLFTISPGSNGLKRKVKKLILRRGI